MAKPEPTQPISQGQKQQQQQAIQQSQQKATQAAKANVPPAVAKQIPPGAQAKLSKDNTALTVKDPASGSSRVLDAKTGKPLLSYNKSTGASPTAIPDKATAQTSGGVTTYTAPGYKKTVNSSGSVTIVNNVTINETIVDKNTTIINNSVSYHDDHGAIVNVTIAPDRPMVRTYDTYHGGYYPVYHPTWWGAPKDMAGGWVGEGGIHVYGEFFAFDGFVVTSYVSPWHEGVGFVSWQDNPYQCQENDWLGWHQRWGWHWYDDEYRSFYAGYYAPIYVYPNLGWWIADYRIQRELETERLERIAAEEDATFLAEEQTEWADNAVALQEQNEPISDATFEVLADQAQDMVSAINDGQTLFASWEVQQGYTFTVEHRMNEIATIDGVDYTCHLRSGDLIKPDSAFDLDEEPVVGDDGLPVIDDYGNVEYTTYVTMDVVASKQHDCITGSRVVVQMDQLQTLLDEERARVQDAMEQSIVVGIHP